MEENLYQNICKQAVKMHQAGLGREKILHYIATEAETVSGYDTAASILLLDENGLLRNAASPQLPNDYLLAIDGLKPNAEVGTCAAAAATGNVVITPSFYADNKWAELRHLPLALGYVGAWSMPIKTDDNRIIGTFGTYFRHQRQPSSAEIQGVGLLASAVAALVTSYLQVDFRAQL